MTFRNTDNAWMETVAVNFHDDTGEKVGRWQLKAGDDAKLVNYSVSFKVSFLSLELLCGILKKYKKYKNSKVK